jgi:hypothetical protein
MRQAVSAETAPPQARTRLEWAPGPETRVSRTTPDYDAAATRPVL